MSKSDKKASDEPEPGAQPSVTTTTTITTTHKPSTVYIVIKCTALENLQQCISSGTWAFKSRLKPPQPLDILQTAHAQTNFEDGRVILVFSVNNQHGWHGYCYSLFHHQSKSKKDLTFNFDTLDTDNATNSNIEEEVEVKELANMASESEADHIIDSSSCNIGIKDKNDWCRFPVEWKLHFLSLNSYDCLPSNATKDLTLEDGTSVNQARNWQILSQTSGRQIVNMMDEHFNFLTKKRDAVEKEKIKAFKEKESESFFRKEQDLFETESNMDDGAAWQCVIQKVERELGKVMLACPFGSQRYNCRVENSDSDLLIVYQAKTVDMLGLTSPPQTLKNSLSSKLDYTVLELQRYCELLVAGDPRYIETLFIEETSSILAAASQPWKDLCQLRNNLVSRDCLAKYVREAKGTKGLKLFDKWKAELKESNIPSAKMNKLGYIVLRMLQSAKELVSSRGVVNIQVYRPTGSMEQQALLKVRQGGFAVSELSKLFQSFLSDIEAMQDSMSFAPTEAVKAIVQEWLVKQRLQDLNPIS